MQQWPASKRDQQQCNPVLDTENIRTAILTAIFTIELNCGEIAKPQRIARGLKGLHQNRGKSTNCKKTSPVAPRNDIHSQSKPGPKYRDGNPDHNLHNRIELRRDCEIAKNCQGAERIAPKSRIIHNPRPDQSDFQAICTSIAMQIHNRITINAIRLQSTKLNWIATERPRESQSRPSFAIHPGRNRHNQTRLQLDCKTTKDCNSIGRVASKLHGLQGNRDQQSIEVAAN